jgi:PAS domain S-box-containing protein
MEKHYIMKENLLFPIVEQHIEQNKCELLMWSIHDDIRRNLKELINFLENKKTDVKEFNQLIGALFFDVRSMVFREEQVLLPAILDKIPPSVFAELEKEQFQEKQVDPSMLSVINQERKIDLGTGLITPVQLVYLFNNLPVDITLVDEDDRVVYFNTPKERLFPRTKAVVGRTVQNCHPPESIDVVEKILLAFKQKKQSSAHFRINLRGRFVQISYYPIYDNNGTYKGTMEVSQDISELRTLEGEKRLLDWDDN